MYFRICFGISIIDIWLHKSLPVSFIPAYDKRFHVAAADANQDSIVAPEAVAMADTA